MARVYSPLARFVNNEISKIYYDPDDRENYLGDICELLVEYGLKWFFWDNEFRIGKFRNRTFNINLHYGANKVTGKGGVDFYVIFRVGWKTYRVFTEVKNWDDWLYYPKPNVSNKRYNKQILNRYEKYQGFTFKHHVLVIPFGYIKNLKSRCKKDKITIIPLEDYLIPELIHVSLINSNLKYFLHDFSDYINSIVKGGLTIKVNDHKKQTKRDKILYDIKRGMPTGLIKEVHNTSKDYIYRVKSEAKKGKKWFIYR